MPKQRKTLTDRWIEGLIDRWEVDLEDGDYKVFWTAFHEGANWPYNFSWERFSAGGAFISGSGHPFKTREEMEAHIEKYKFKPVAYQQTTLF